MPIYFAIPTVDRSCVIQVNSVMYDSILLTLHTCVTCSHDPMTKMYVGNLKNFINFFSQMMHGILQKESGLVQRKRVRDSINRVSPVPVINRLSKTIKRRHYSVAMSNSLWHLDGHMKLIR